MNVDELAAASQREFQALRNEMATKEDVKDILRAIEGIDLHIASYSSRWTDDFAKLHDWMQELDNRVKLLEKSGR
jgi:hypothetical protein